MFRFEFGMKKCLQPSFIVIKHYCKGPFNLHSKLNRGCTLPRFKLVPFKSINSYFSTNSLKHDSVKANVENIEEAQTSNKKKTFIESESNFHHQVLERLNVYSNTTFKEDPDFNERYCISEKDYKELINIEDWCDKSPYDVAVSFISLGVYSASQLHLTMDDERFDKMINAFVGKSKYFSDDQLIDCLVAIQVWPSSENVKAPNYLKVWKALDNVCFERLYDWSIDKILFIMDLWFHINLTRLSIFNYKGLAKITNRCKDLARSQMIQTMFYMSCNRSLHPSINLRDYEYHLQGHITHLTIEEIGIIAVAFFKTKKPILNIKLLMYIMQRVVQDIDVIPSITLTAITKCLRLSHRAEIGFTANDVVKKLVERRADSLNLVDLIHTVHISTQVQFYNEDAITALAEKFCNNPSAARLKDMERIAYILSLFDYIPPTIPNILDIFIEQLNMQNHIEAGETHKIAMLSLVYYLTLMRVYSETRIQDLLSDENIRLSYQSKFLIPKQIVQIEYNRVLEGPVGSEYLLSPTMREYLARRHSDFYPDEKREAKNQFDIMMKGVMDITNDVLGGREYNMVAYTLPHFSKADILFKLDEAGCPVEIPEEMRTRQAFVDVIRAPDLKGWYAVVIGGRNMFMHNVPKLIGEQRTKLRQLQLLGYTPILIPSHYWQTEKDKAAYLKLKYFTRPST